MYIYVELNTGIVKNEPIRSNFYVYRLHKGCLPTVKKWISQAGLSDVGLTYPDEFAAYLNKHDTKWDQKSGLPVPFHAREY